jgi:hypothetical protein
MYIILFIILTVIILYIKSNMQNTDSFLDKMPYNNLEMRNYKQMYDTPTQPKKEFLPKVPTSGYHQEYLDYYIHPENLSDYAIGYSVSGEPYNGMKKADHMIDKREVELAHLDEPYYFDKAGWIRYKPAPKQANYIGYPFYYH